MPNLVYVYIYYKLYAYKSYILKEEWGGLDGMPPQQQKEHVESISS